MKHLLICIVSATTLVLVGACGGDDAADTEAKMEQEASKHGVDADVTVDDDGNIERVEIQRGASTVGQNVSLPAGFPADIDVPADWNVMAVTPVPGLGGFSIQALASSDADSILATVSDSMIANGWTTAATDPSPLPKAAFEKDGRIANVSIIPNGETNAVTLVTMNKPQ